MWILRSQTLGDPAIQDEGVSAGIAECVKHLARLGSGWGEKE
jgi:hypothetical protein